jgi:hypothetical protein
MGERKLTDAGRVVPVNWRDERGGSQDVEYKCSGRGSLEASVCIAGGSIGNVSARRARTRVEQAIRRVRSTSAVGKVIVAIAALIAGVLEERGPEMASKGLELAKEKLPVAAEKAKVQVKVIRAMIRERRSGGWPRS